MRLEEQALSEEALARCVDFAELRVVDEVGTEVEDWPEFWADASRLVVLAAGLELSEAKELVPVLVELGAPIVAEATANLHGFAQLQGLLVEGGERALKGLDVGRVLRIGAVPSWRWWRDLEGRPEVKVLNVSRAPFRGLARKEEVRLMDLRGFLRSGVKSGKGVCKHDAGDVQLAELLSIYPNSEVAWMGHVARCIGKQVKVFLGNSLPIREWNLGVNALSAGVSFYANRGANGIDGLVSTWLGVSAEVKEAWLVLGDLSALYDANALWVVPQLKAGKRRLVVINNAGGQIFSRVGWLRSLPESAREMLVNPHELRFKAWAEMWGAGYRLFEDHRQLSALLDQEPEEALEVWEIRPDAAESVAFWRDWD